MAAVTQLVQVVAGETIKDVREKTFEAIYTGSGLGADATKFVMTSEGDATITLANPTIDTDENKIIYYFDCIHIERLAARIDYCTKGSIGYSEEYGGFVYENEKQGHGPNAQPNKDLYVVTKVTPFNLYSESEYYFKRVRDTWADNQTPTITYLGDESTTNWVVDPYTAEKTTITHGAGPANPDVPNPDVSYINRLEDLLPADGPGNPYPDNSYSQVMATVHSTSSHTDEQNNNNIIIAYPRENTLLPNSLFKWYATGIVFEVDIYRDVMTNQNPHKETKRYYHYLRHQGEQLDANQHSFKAKELKKNEVEKDKETCVYKGNGPGANEVLVPMRCGIVRNNIYRVSIASFSDEEGTITLTIEEEKWRHVDNPVIYI